jgi:hypothetical protein
MAERKSNSIVEFPGKGLKLRGIVDSINRGVKKRTAVANADGSVDTHEEPGMSELKVTLSMVADQEAEAIEAIVGEPCLVTFANKSKIRFASMTHTESAEITKEGTMQVTFQGSTGKPG